MTNAILTLNAGSSSLKFSLFELMRGDLQQTAGGEIEAINDKPHFVARVGGKMVADRTWPAENRPTYESLLSEVLAWSDAHLGGDRLTAVGHRIVHGGAEFVAPVRIDEAIIEKLERLIPLAPLHQPQNIAAIRAIGQISPSLPQVGCFDTAFHHNHKPEVYRFGLPREWEDRGVRRYGFHGLSYEFIAGRMRDLDPNLASGRMIVAHLGSGASLCAIQGGESHDTTMSFTALDGLVMGTRCGALDPGVILYLEQEFGFSAQDVEDMLYKRSGLLGVSQISGDMRALLMSSDPRAEDAISLFVFRIIREIGALAAAMGGIDGLVFTAGIGEHAPEIRKRVCEALGWLGVSLDAEANAAGDGRINAPCATTAVWAIHTNEDLQIARHTREITSRSGTDRARKHKPSQG